ncbi:MAG: ROK family protein [Planctomycetota bacterium]|jgi:glucokinase
MSESREYYLGIDLGGTKIKGCLVSRNGEVHTQREAETRDAGDAAWIDGVKRLIASIESDIQGESIVGVGLAAPGIAAHDARSIAEMPGRLEGLVGLDWSESIGRPTRVLNDAHACTLGEAWLGAARGRQHVALLTLGTGVGGGVICNGKLLLGAQRRAGHLGHISLDPEGELDITRLPGSLEDAIGEVTLAKRSGGRFSRTVDLLKAKREGDAEAGHIWATSVRALAAAIASFINLFDSEVVVLGGGVSQAGDELLSPLRARLDEIEWRYGDTQVPVVLAELGPWAGAVGAANYAMQEGD